MGNSSKLDLLAAARSTLELDMEVATLANIETDRELDRTGRGNSRPGVCSVRMPLQLFQLLQWRLHLRQPMLQWQFQLLPHQLLRLLLRLVRLLLRVEVLPCLSIPSVMILAFRFFL
jgi:hypothetical protein